MAKFEDGIMEKKNPMSAAPMSRQTMEAHFWLHFKNQRKTKFRQLRVKAPLSPSEQIFIHFHSCSHSNSHNLLGYKCYLCYVLADFITTIS